jgi:hypothetical protein
MAVWGTSQNQQITGVGPIIGSAVSGVECEWRPNLLNPGRLPFARALKVAFVTTVMVFPATAMKRWKHSRGAGQEEAVARLSCLINQF